MWELYLITRVDIIGAIAGLILVCNVLIFIFILLMGGLDDELPNRIKSIQKYNCIIGIISLIAVTFIPTKEDLLLIYGLGPTIDYIQDNEKVKELPDKCVEALDKWIDSLNDKD